MLLLFRGVALYPDWNLFIFAPKCFDLIMVNTIWTPVLLGEFLIQEVLPNLLSIYQNLYLSRKRTYLSNKVLFGKRKVNKNTFRILTNCKRDSAVESSSVCWATLCFAFVTS